MKEGSRSYRPQVLSALELRTLKPDVEPGFGEPMTKAVISVPAYLSDAGRRGAG
ncbi:Hsp70 family protein [Pseudomonas abietaniphila]